MNEASDPMQPSIGSSPARLTKNIAAVLVPGFGPFQPLGEVNSMLSPRIKLALFVIASALAASFVGDVPWGP
jgi:hypothetical protein